MNDRKPRKYCIKCNSYFCKCPRTKTTQDCLYLTDFEKIVETTNTVVLKCITLVKNKEMVIKKIRFESDEVVSKETIAEISAIRELKHLNIVSLIYASITDNILYLLYEFFPIDLKKYMDDLPNGQLIETQLVKNYLHQITQGIQFCHERGTIHRELKPQNVLIDNNGVIKLADFGLARDLDIRVHTLGVVTQCYRAPEALLGSPSDSFAIDIWSIGCIFAEMATRRPLFQDDSDSKIDQLIKIFNVMSTPTKDTWPGFSDLPGYKSSFPTFPDNNLKDSVNELDPLGFDLLQKMLVYLPSLRINAESILKHPYFDDFDKRLLPMAPLDDENLLL